VAYIILAFIAKAATSFQKITISSLANVLSGYCYSCSSVSYNYQLLDISSDINLILTESCLNVK
jgi:hypothetical protein